MPLDALTIADCFLNRARRQGNSISPLKLQKLVFFAHGWYSGFTGKPLISNVINAWKYGPVIPDLYHALKAYGSSPVTASITSADSEASITGMDPQLPSLLDEIWRVYGQQTAVQLSALSHEAGGPWDNIVKGRSPDEFRNMKIDQEEIRGHFEKKVQRLKEAKNARTS